MYTCRNVNTNVSYIIVVFLLKNKIKSDSVNSCAFEERHCVINKFHDYVPLLTPLNI